LVNVFQMVPEAIGLEFEIEKLEHISWSKSAVSQVAL